MVIVCIAVSVRAILLEYGRVILRPVLGFASFWFVVAAATAVCVRIESCARRLAGYVSLCGDLFELLRTMFSETETSRLLATVLAAITFCPDGFHLKPIKVNSFSHQATYFLLDAKKVVRQKSLTVPVLHYISPRVSQSSVCLSFKVTACQSVSSSNYGFQVQLIYH